MVLTSGWVVRLQDMDLVPLLIQENYLNHRPAKAGSEIQQMQVCLPGSSQKFRILISRLQSQDCNFNQVDHPPPAHWDPRIR